MEVALVLTTGLLAGLSSLALLGGEALTPLAAGRAARVLSLRALRLLRRLSATWLVDRALRWGAAAALASELSQRDVPRALGMGRAEVAAALMCALALVSLAAAALLGSLVAGVAAGCLAMACCGARDASRRRRVRREVVAAMPGVYRTLAVALGSGQTLAQAVEYVGAHERGRAGAVFGRMSLRLRCGMGTEQAVELLAGELEVPGARLLAAALVISHRTGSPLRELLARSARLAERQGEFERLLSVKTAQVRLSVRIVCALPAAMLAILALVSPDFQRGLLTPVGVGCVALAVALDLAALAIIGRMVRGVL